MIDDAKQRREFSRWVLLLALYNAHPVGSWEEVLLSTLQAIYPDTTKNEVRRELDYLDDRKLLDDHQASARALVRRDQPSRHRRRRVHTDVHPGIARPPKV
jgi:Fe2+ or Zn2+ uptake regulation protein